MLEAATSKDFSCKDSACFSVLNVETFPNLIPKAAIICAVSGLSPEIVDSIPMKESIFVSFINSCKTIVSMEEIPDKSMNRCSMPSSLQRTGTVSNISFARKLSMSPIREEHQSNQ